MPWAQMHIYASSLIGKCTTEEILLENEARKKHRGQLVEGLVMYSDTISAGRETPECWRRGSDLPMSVSRKISEAAVE